MNFKISYAIVCHHITEVNVAEGKYLNSVFCHLFLPLALQELEDIVCQSCRKAFVSDCLSLASAECHIPPLTL